VSCRQNQLTLTTSMDFIQLTLYYGNGTYYNATPAYGFSSGNSDAASQQATYVVGPCQPVGCGICFFAWFSRNYRST
jgi:hypothetical protein